MAPASRLLFAPLALVGSLIFCPAAHSDAVKLLRETPTLNSRAARAKPYVLMVLLDGFRAGFINPTDTPALYRLAQAGAWAPEGSRPVYPSVSSPNHYALATGLEPRDSGVVENTFFMPEVRQSFDIYAYNSGTDGRTFQGEPIWVTAQKSGVNTACILIIGCQARIEDRFPTWYAIYDHENAGASSPAKLQAVRALYARPAADRPHLILVLFDAVDHVAHRYGPTAPQTRLAIQILDRTVADLTAEVRRTGLAVNVIIVADHGTDRIEGPAIYLDRYTDLGDAVTIGSQIYAATESERQRIYLTLKDKSPAFQVFRLADAPPHLAMAGQSRFGDPVVVATGPFLIRARSGSDAWATEPQLGTHSWDPTVVPSMNGVFLAYGPGIRPRTRIAGLRNTDVRDLIGALLHLPQTANAGRKDMITRIIQSPDQGGIRANAPAGKGRPLGRRAPSD